MERSYARAMWYGFDRARWMERALAGTDTGVPGLCCPEHSSLAEVRILSQEKSLGHDGADQGVIAWGHKVFLGVAELVNSKIAQRVPLGSVYPRLSFIET